MLGRTDRGAGGFKCEGAGAVGASGDWGKWRRGRRRAGAGSGEIGRRLRKVLIGGVHRSERERDERGVRAGSAAGPVRRFGSAQLGCLIPFFV